MLLLLLNSNLLWIKNQPSRAIPHGRFSARYELHLHGWFCRPWLLLIGDDNTAAAVQGQVSGPHHSAARQSRVAPDHPGLRLLRRVHEQVRQRESVEDLLQVVWLFDYCGHRRWQCALCSRWSLAWYQDARSDSTYRTQSGIVFNKLID